MYSLARYRPEFIRALGNRKFRNPDTGNQVLFQSLPSQEQQKVYQQWAARNAPQEDPVKAKEIDTKVDKFLEHGRIPDNPVAVLQLMVLDKVLSSKDRPYFERVVERINKYLDKREREQEERRKNRKWWQKMLNIQASSKVADQWFHQIVALEASKQTTPIVGQ